MSSPDHILYDLVSKVDSKLDALNAKLDEKFGDLSPRVTALEVEMRQAHAALAHEVTRRQSAESEVRGHKRNTAIAAGSGALAVVAAVAQALIGG